MSVFNPTSLTGQPDQKKMLLERLMQQYQEMAGRAAGLQQAQSSVGGVVGGTPFHAVHPFGGVGLVTALAHGLPADLIAKLGPGAIGTPSPGHTGSGVVGNGPPIGNPHAGGNPGSPSGPSNPIPAVTAVPGAAAAIGAGGPGGATAPAPSLGQDALSIFASSPNKLDLVNQIVQRRPNIYNSPFHAFGGGGRI